MYRLTWFIYWRSVLGAVAFAILCPLLLYIVEFPIMLLVAIVSRLLGNPWLAGTISGYVNQWISTAWIYIPITAGIFFFVLRAVLRQAIGKKLGGKVLLIQDAEASAVQ